MATVKEERARLQFFEEHGRGDEKVHVVFVEQDAKERVANKKEKTRFVMETDSPEIYSRMNAARDKLFARLNKAVALEIMTKRWELSEAEMDELAKGEEPEIETGSLGDA